MKRLWQNILEGSNLPWNGDSWFLWYVHWACTLIKPLGTQCRCYQHIRPKSGSITHPCNEHSLPGSTRTPKNCKNGNPNVESIIPYPISFSHGSHNEHDISRLACTSDYTTGAPPTGSGCSWHPHRMAWKRMAPKSMLPHPVRGHSTEIRSTFIVHQPPTQTECTTTSVQLTRQLYAGFIKELGHHPLQLYDINNHKLSPADSAWWKYKYVDTTPSPGPSTHTPSNQCLRLCSRGSWCWSSYKYRWGSSFFWWSCWSRKWWEPRKSTVAWHRGSGTPGLPPDPGGRSGQWGSGEVF